MTSFLWHIPSYVHSYHINTEIDRAIYRIYTWENGIFLYKYSLFCLMNFFLHLKFWMNYSVWSLILLRCMESIWWARKTSLKRMMSPICRHGRRDIEILIELLMWNVTGRHFGHINITGLRLLPTTLLHSLCIKMSLLFFVVNSFYGAEGILSYFTGIL